MQFINVRMQACPCWFLHPKYLKQDKINYIPIVPFAICISRSPRHGCICPCPCATKVFLPPFYLWGFSHEKKYQALSAYTNSILHSRAEEPGKEANTSHVFYCVHLFYSMQNFTVMVLILWMTSSSRKWPTMWYVAMCMPQPVYCDLILHWKSF